jgi:aspartate/methionine/tyrosine aminotransferase
MTVQLPDFRLEVYLGKWEFKARHHLTASDAETLTIGELLALGTDEERSGFASLGLGYAPTWGSDDLRTAIAGTYETVDAERHVLAFAGAEEAMYWALQELVGPGDHAIVTLPNYQSMETLTLRTGAEVSGWALRPDNDWAPDLDELEALIRPNTRLIAVNFPNNPTGALPDRETFVALAALCDRHEIVLFSDEVYRGLERDPSRRLPQACDLSERALSLNVMSKAYGLPGLRIGWLATHDHDLLARLERRKHYTSICNAGPSEFLATLALRNGDAIRARNRAIIEHNLPVFDAFFARWSECFAWEHPQAGCVCFPRYLGGDVSRFCRELVEDVGVVLLPADIYASELGAIPRDRFRIGVGRRDPEPALEAFETFLEGR